MKWFRKKKNMVEEKTTTAEAPVNKDPHRLIKLVSGKFSAYCIFRENGRLHAFDSSNIVYVSDDRDIFQAKLVFTQKSSNYPMTDKTDVVETTYEQTQTWSWVEGMFDSSAYSYRSNGYTLKHTTPKALVSEKVVDTPLDAFRREGKFMLITDEEEFKKYLNSSMDIQTWCYNKIYDAFRAYGLDSKWITENAVRIHNDLEKYNKALALMEELKYERDSISRFMYLFTCAFV